MPRTQVQRRQATSSRSDGAVVGSGGVLARSHAVPAVVSDVLRAPGQSLDPMTRRAAEQSIGHDFSRVRVHTDGVAAVSADALAAEAWTFGSHVAFATGRYTPGSPAGRQL